MQLLFKDHAVTGSVEVYHLDLMSMSSVRSFAQTILSLDIPIHVLINNAGIMAIPKYTTSAQGIELQWATNHLGHFLISLTQPRNILFRVE